MALLSSDALRLAKGGAAGEFAGKLEKALGEQGIVCMEDLIHEIVTCGPNFKKANNFLWPFKLSNPKGGFDGRVLVISHAKHVKFVNGAGKVQLRDGDGKLELTSDVAEPFQLSLKDVAQTGLRTASVLRTHFQALKGVRAIFGDIGPLQNQKNNYCKVLKKCTKSGHNDNYNSN